VSRPQRWLLVVSIAGAIWLFVAYMILVVRP